MDKVIMKLIGKPIQVESIKDSDHYNKLLKDGYEHVEYKKGRKVVVKSLAEVCKTCEVKDKEIENLKAGKIDATSDKALEKEIKKVAELDAELEKETKLKEQALEDALSINEKALETEAKLTEATDKVATLEADVEKLNLLVSEKQAIVDSKDAEIKKLKEAKAAPKAA